MKRLLLLIFLCGSLLISLSAQAAITRFAVVDMNRITAVYAERSPEAKAFVEKRDKVQAEIDKQNNELLDLNAKLAEALEQGKKDLAKNLENQIRTKTQALQNYIKTSFAELDTERENFLKNEAFMKPLISIIRSVAESEGYTMVLNKTEGSGIIWYSPSIDITNKVIERIRSGKR